VPRELWIIVQTALVCVQNLALSNASRKKNEAKIWRDLLQCLLLFCASFFVLGRSKQSLASLESAVDEPPTTTLDNAN